MFPGGLPQVILQNLATGGPSSPLSFLQQSPFLGRHPYFWGKTDVEHWLQWCKEEYSLADINIDKFCMNGKALCMLKKEDFCSRDPNSGDILYNTLQKITEKVSIPQVHSPLFNLHPFNFFPGINSHVSRSLQSTPLLTDHSVTDINSHGSSQLSVPYQRPQSSSPILRMPKPITHQRHSMSIPGGAISRHLEEIVPLSRHPVPETVLSPPPSNAGDVTDFSGSESSPRQDSRQEIVGFTDKIHIDTSESPTVVAEDESEFMEEEDSHTPSLAVRSGDSRLLWEFISRLLTTGQCTHLVRWENFDQLIFKIVSPSGLAHLWGIQKNRNNMTYEKMSRALRYYYKMGIIQKVPGKRLTYRFMKPPNEIKRSRRGSRPMCSVIKYSSQDSDCPRDTPHNVLHSHNMQQLHSHIKQQQTSNLNSQQPDAASINPADPSDSLQTHPRQQYTNSPLLDTIDVKRTMFNIKTEVDLATERICQEQNLLRSPTGADPNRNITYKDKPQSPIYTPVVKQEYTPHVSTPPLQSHGEVIGDIQKP